MSKERDKTNRKINYLPNIKSIKMDRTHKLKKASETNIINSENKLQKNVYLKNYLKN